MADEILKKIKTMSDESYLDNMASSEIIPYLEALRVAVRSLSAIDENTPTPKGKLNYSVAALKEIAKILGVKGNE